MHPHLTIREQKYLQEYLKSSKRVKPFPAFSYVYSAIISFAGLILMIAVSVITLQNMNDHTVYRVFLPGLIAGLVIILLGYVLLRYSNKFADRRKLASIIEKLLDKAD